MDRYSLKELSKIFQMQANQYEKYKIEMREKYPDDEAWKNEFNLPLALYSICQEIEGLKSDLDKR